jgi:hypothetical protein
MTSSIYLCNCSVLIEISKDFKVNHSVCFVFVLFLVVARILVVNGNPRRVVCAPNIIKFKNVGRIFLLLRKKSNRLDQKERQS